MNILLIENIAYNTLKLILSEVLQTLLLNILFKGLGLKIHPMIIW